MTERTTLGLALAFAASVALNWGFFAQHRAASAMPPLSMTRPLGSLKLLFSNARWLSGYVVGIVGWAMYIAALAFAPLSLVQAIAAGGIGVLALLVWWSGGVRLARRDWAGVSAALVGLALLSGSLEGAGVGSKAGDWTQLAGWIVASSIIAGCVWLLRSRLFAPGAGSGIVAGLMYAAGDVATKASLGPSRELAFVPVLLLCHLLGFVTLQGGFQEGEALATAGLASVLNNGLPIAAGLTIFGEPPGRGATGALRLCAFVAVVVGAALLARGRDAHPTTERIERRRSAWAGRGIEPATEGLRTPCSATELPAPEDRRTVAEDTPVDP